MAVARGIGWCSLAAAAVAIVMLSSHLFLTPLFASPRLLWQQQQQDQRLDTVGQLLKVYLVDLGPEFNYGLLEEGEQAAYPDNPLWKQYSAEYWLLGDLLSGLGSRAIRVLQPSEADVLFVPFFASLSAELQLSKSRGKFRYPRDDNEDYVRQRRVVDIVKSTEAWKRSGGRDHVFALTDPMAMWHVRADIASCILLVVDFGGWYTEDAKQQQQEQQQRITIQHTQVSLIKDVIVPFTHLLPNLALSEDGPRSTLLYFKGARHRHRTGLIRDKLWSILESEAGVVLEEGFPNKTGQLQAMKGMRSSHFCLHPAGDTPSSCRLFDAVSSLCIPVIVSDWIELPFEGAPLDYTEFSVFASVQQALQPGWLVQRLKEVSASDRNRMRRKLAAVQRHFEFDNGFPGGRGRALKEGAVNMIWNKILSKVPAVKEAIARDRRRPSGATTVSRCQCL